MEIFFYASFEIQTQKEQEKNRQRMHSQAFSASLEWNSTTQHENVISPETKQKK